MLATCNDALLGILTSHPSGLRPSATTPHQVRAHQLWLHGLCNSRTALLKQSERICAIAVKQLAPRAESNEQLGDLD